MPLSAVFSRFAAAAAVGLVTVAMTGCGTYYYDSEPAEYAQQGVDPGDGTVVAASANLTADGTAVEGDGEDVVVGADDDEYADTDPSALTDFRGTLDPYGTWVDDGTYGTVWVPSSAVVGADFAPYVTNGHWVYGDDYEWVSDYDWGWVPFHYGRWVYIQSRGWGWIPGREYAGAWVSWRVGPDGYDYVGWGPMAPTWYWLDGVAYRFGFDIYTPYTFCDRDDLFDRHVGRHTVRGPSVRGIATRTRPWTPANPGVAGPHRTPASPQVGPHRTPASPQVGPPHHGASPSRVPLGPPPSSLGLQASKIARAPASDAGLTRALAYSRPSSAVRFGAHAPRRFVASSGGYPLNHATTIGREPGAYSRPVATSPRYVQGAHAYQSPYVARPTQVYRSPSGGQYARPTQVYRAPQQYTRPTQSYRAPAWSDSRPTRFRAPSAPSYHAPAYRAPAYHAPATRSFQSSYHGSSSGSSSSSSHHYAAPSHSSHSSRAFHR